MVIVDAGGGTVDISSYSRNQQDKTFEEIAPPQCLFVFITLKIANFCSLYTRSLPRLCFCDDQCNAVFKE